MVRLVGLFLSSFACSLILPFVRCKLVGLFVDYPFVRCIVCSLLHSLAHAFVPLFRLFCSFVRSLARTFVCLFTGGLVSWFVHLIAHAFVPLFRLFCSFVRSLSLARSSACSLVGWLVRPVICLCILSLVCSLVAFHWFVYTSVLCSFSLILLFVCHAIFLLIVRLLTRSFVYFFSSFVSFCFFSLFIAHLFVFSDSFPEPVYSHQYHKAQLFKSLFTSVNPRLFC